MDDLISRQAAIDALWKALYELDVGEWIGHRIFVQNMNDIDRQTILNLPSAQPEIIRCKDCKFSHMTNDGRYCKYCDQFTDDYGELVEMYFDSDFYCGYAERRTE